MKKSTIETSISVLETEIIHFKEMGSGCLSKIVAGTDRRDEEAHIKHCAQMVVDRKINKARLQYQLGLLEN